MDYYLNIILAIFILLLIPTIEIKSQEDNVDCNGKLTYTKTPPFFVSDAHKHKNQLWDNFRENTKKRPTIGYIPKGSIVKRAGINVDDFVPVKVVSLPSKETEEEFSKIKIFKKTFMNNKRLRNLKRVEKDDIGLLHRLALYNPTDNIDCDKLYKEKKCPKKPKKKRKACKKNNKIIKKNKKICKNKKHSPKKKNFRKKSYYFSLKTDAPIHLMDVKFDLQSNYLVIKTNENDEYLKCCENDFAEDSCYYYFEIKNNNEDNNLSNYYKFSKNDCLLKSLLPLPREAVKPFLKIQEIIGKKIPLNELQYINYGLGNYPKKSLIKFPFVDPSQGTSVKGPLGSIHYKYQEWHKNTQKAEEDCTDCYMDPITACNFAILLKKWDEICPKIELGCSIIWGDAFSPKNYTHKTHYKGTCLDIKLFRKNDNKVEGLKISARRYDRKKTEAFIKLLHTLHIKKDKIIFNDKRIKNHKRLYIPRPNHDDHIHFCFPENNKKMEEQCFNYQTDEY